VSTLPGPLRLERLFFSVMEGGRIHRCGKRSPQAFFFFFFSLLTVGVDVLFPLFRCPPYVLEYVFSSFPVSERRKKLGAPLRSSPLFVLFDYVLACIPFSPTFERARSFRIFPRGSFFDLLVSFLVFFYRGMRGLPYTP